MLIFMGLTKECTITRLCKSALTSVQHNSPRPYRCDVPLGAFDICLCGRREGTEGQDNHRRTTESSMGHASSCLAEPLQLIMHRAVTNNQARETADGTSNTGLSKLHSTSRKNGRVRTAFRTRSPMVVSSRFDHIPR